MDRRGRNGKDCKLGLNYLSVCSGIEAASVAWEPIGWSPAAFAEIEPFPAAVLKARYPNIPNLGDLTNHEEWNFRRGAIDILVGGTPCQPFSVAGLRRGLQDPRGNLTLSFLALAEKLRPRWLVWENVPGVLTDKTNAFGQLLCGLEKCGYRYAYRVLDAQYWGVPQRRRRVFIVANTRASRRHPAEVLFEPESLQGDLTPSRPKGHVYTPGVKGSTGEGSVCARVTTIDAQNEIDRGDSTQLARLVTCNLPHREVVGSLTNGAKDGSGLNGQDIRTGRIIAFNSHSGLAVRRLTPRECERLQGFPDDYTMIEWKGKPPLECPHSPRYKSIGNSMAVPVMRWIGERIATCID